MKILVYSANFAPEPTGIGKYSGEMAAWLAARGHEVRAICAPPYYPSWRVDPAYRWPPYRHERWQGVHVWRAPLWVPRMPGGLRRVLHLASFAISSLPLALRQARWSPDVVFVVAPFLLCAPAGWLLARFRGARCWLHVQDFEVDVAFQMGQLRGRRTRQRVEALERWLLRRFDRVSSISQRMLERLRAKGVPADRIRALPNWVDVDRLRPLGQASAYRAELGMSSDQVVALFSGTLGSKQGLLLIPAAARLLAHRGDIVFVVCGDGVMKSALEAACAGMTNIRMLPLQPAERLAELLGLADMHLLTQSPEAEDLVLPSKLGGMLASGRPVVATCRRGTEIAETLEGCGVVVPPEDALALARAVQDLTDSPDRRAALGASARKLAESTMGMCAVLSALECEMIGLIAKSS